MPETDFFSPTDDGLLVPRPSARGPWSPDMLHGRLLVGLAAWAVERDHGGDGFLPVRLTVDLYRSPAMKPASVTTTLVRSGGRVRAVDAVISVDGVDVARASALLLRRSEAVADDAPVTAPWDAPPPATDSGATGLSADVAFDVRPAGEHGFGAPGPGPRRMWLRDRGRLVAGVELTPYVRAALCADFASPLANSTPDGLDYINADAALYLARLPTSEWIGIETHDRVVADGVSVAQSVLHDDTGPIGWASACAVLTARMDRPQQ